MLSPTVTPPHTITPEEHSTITSSTPTSFVDIPPVLRWLDQVEVFMAPTSGGWEGWTGAGIGARVGGSLYVTEASVTFIPNTNGDGNSQIQGFDLPYQALTLHALTPADQSTQTPAHLYCQVDESDAPSPLTTTTATASNGNGHGNGAAADDDEDEDEDEGYVGDEFTEMREVRIFLPEAKLEPLFQALSSCSALHASLLPNGEPSSFFGGFGGGDDDDEYDDDGEQGQWEDAAEDGTADGGRVRNGQNGPSARFRPY
ncbi:hypothetical protein IAT40_005356 [Kwoniella sp. CBS 6097]